ncbi:MAG: hypothetical protein EOP21_12300 [Hyphomicrobiales bacterium]|nr:MAG: hypothetical protein EOP21_12300 [Hyphomicrobiales bacterium]
MGDLVRSEHTTDRAKLHERFNEAVRAANHQHRHQIVSPLTITLGDEFQGLSRTLGASLKIVQQIRWALLKDGIECRFVIGLAELSTPINTEIAWNMMGHGLARAREKLGQKREANAYRFSLPDDPTIESLMDAVGLSVTDIESEWTPRQREIALRSLEQPDRSAALIKAFDVKESVFYKVRRAAKYDLYQTLMGCLSQTLAVLDEETA